MEAHQTICQLSLYWTAKYSAAKELRMRLYKWQEVAYLEYIRAGRLAEAAMDSRIMRYSSLIRMWDVRIQQLKRLLQLADIEMFGEVQPHHG